LTRPAGLAMLRPLRAHAPFARSRRSADKEVRPRPSTEGMILGPKRSVLVVDRSEETREVLRTALERRGLRTLAASRARRGLELARQHRPDLIVLDIESEGTNSEETYARFARQSLKNGTALLMLGHLRPSEASLGGEEFIAKPYHFGPLIRRIEELVEATGQTLARCA